MSTRILSADRLVCFAYPTVAARALSISKLGRTESVLAFFTAFGKVDQSLFPRKDIVSITKAVVCARKVLETSSVHSF